MLTVAVVVAGDEREAARARSATRRGENCRRDASTGGMIVMDLGGLQFYAAANSWAGNIVMGLFFLVL